MEIIECFFYFLMWTLWKKNGDAIKENCEILDYGSNLNDYCFTFIGEQCSLQIVFLSKILYRVISITAVFFFFFTENKRFI